MTAGLIALEVGHRELFMPAWVFGLIAFGVLLTAAIALHGYSQNRPHS